MSSSISEEKENPVVTLRAQAEKFGFSKLRAGKDNAEANSGNTAFLDFQRMDFVINGKSISRDLIAELYKEHDSLLPKSEGKNEDYRPFARKVFKEMFKYAKAEVPSDSILEELVINCNQAGYEAGVHIEFQGALSQHLFIIESPEKVISIDCVSQNNVSVKSDMTLPIFFQRSDGTFGDKVCDLSSSLEFTLKSQDDKNVTYTNGNLSLTVPERLKDYNIGDKSLFDIIKEYFQKLCERLGFFKIKIEHGLGDPLEVSDHLENMEPPIRSNEHGLN
ncbi:hypothetical protein [Wolbachia endosymbiont (group A) of Cheilosia soror]|uniref:hypothetical protein n=1 Tax=Wolbachia endosymbiont (group A) of Cheilosia soror TaxID=2953995 RepID=UPI0021F84404|nr:hypothetical protein [Wolbachia endosymbiont (group A) of Cheilosia soror]